VTYLVFYLLILLWLGVAALADRWLRRRMAGFPDFPAWIAPVAAFFMVGAGQVVNGQFAKGLLGFAIYWGVRIQAIPTPPQLRGLHVKEVLFPLWVLLIADAAWVAFRRWRLARPSSQPRFTGSRA